MHRFTRRQREVWMAGLAERWMFLAQNPLVSQETCRQRRRRRWEANMRGRLSDIIEGLARIARVLAAERAP